MPAATTYTDSDKIRSESGVIDNTYITDDSINTERIRANSVINTYIGSRYIIPIATATWANSPAAAYLERIEAILGAAYVLQTAYGTESVDTDKDGYKKEDKAIEMLNQILDGSLKLLGSDGREIPIMSGSDANRLSISGYPRNSDNRKFTTKMVR